MTKAQEFQAKIRTFDKAMKMCENLDYFFWGIAAEHLDKYYDADDFLTYNSGGEL